MKRLRCANSNDVKNPCQNYIGSTEIARMSYGTGVSRVDNRTRCNACYDAKRKVVAHPRQTTGVVRFLKRRPTAMSSTLIFAVVADLIANAVLHIFGF
jgi:hypothetical protein